MKHNTTLILTLVLLALSVYFLAESTYLTWVILAILFSCFIVIAVGSSFIQLNYFVKSIHKGTKGISFTFDDGPDPTITPKILDLLAQEKIKATFFVIGDKIEDNKDLLLRIHYEGHTIGNHSYSHTKKLTMFSTYKLKEDLDKCSKQIEKIIHHKPLFFRPPFGISTPRYNRAIKRLHLTSIGWSTRSLDTISKNKNMLYKKVTEKISNGSIILFHDTQQITLDVLPEIIQFCKLNGMEIVPLPELINKPAYE